MHMSLLFQVDTFTREPFHGNPAAVFLAPEMPHAAWMQAVAAELRMPATAFVAGDGPSRRLRWFTPTTELEICGHGTLAAAHVLWETESYEQIEFTTQAGAIATRRHGDTSFITLDAGDVVETEPPADLLAALGVRAKAWLRDGHRRDHLEAKLIGLAKARDADVFGRAPPLPRWAPQPRRGNYGLRSSPQHGRRYHR